jgi:hypothetical protein
MLDKISIVTSVLALAMSAFTAWFTFLRRGAIRMTQPTVVFFGPDGGAKAHPKNFLRTLLYSTAARGHLLESMHVSVQRGETRQNFNIWVYGDENLRRGSGLFVGRTGTAHNHHFLLPPDSGKFEFIAGRYVVRVYAKCDGDRAPSELAVVELQVSDAHAAELQQEQAGLYFDWGPDLQGYHPRVDIRTPRTLPKWLEEMAS